MKVIFKVIKAGSGNDIYFERLSEALKKIHIESEIEYYPNFFQYVPWLLPLFNKKTAGDIIHSNVEYGWAFKEKNKPLFVTLHHNVFAEDYKKYISFPQYIFYSFILKENIRKSLQLATKRVAVSHYTKESFIRSFGKYDISVIYNFVDTDKYKPIKFDSRDKRFKLLFVGNLTKRKGADLLPKIMEELGSNYVLYYTSGLRTKIPKDFQLPNMIPLEKLTEDKLIQEYNRCDALLSPSRLEGFGYSVVEAMACGKPVITSTNSSLQELLKNNVNGYLCSTDNIKEFMKAINKVRNHNIEQNIVQQRNRRHVLMHFTFNSLISNYKKMYTFN